MTPEHTALVAQLERLASNAGRMGEWPAAAYKAAATIRALAGEVERLSKLDRQASAHVESVVCMRTHFTGEPPYVGWLGIGLSINEVIDERDTLRAEVAALKIDNQTLRDLLAVAEERDEL